MTSERKITQLSAQDAIFLAMDTETSWGHIGGLCILDPSTTDDFSFERLVRTVEQRLRLVPRFRWKIREVGLGLDQPYWVEAHDFDVRDHVHRIAVPSPGSLRELGELAGLLYARKLDRSRPLWEMWFIEGLAGGRVAMFLKTHHCLMDGQAGTGLSEVMSDLTPDATAPVLVPEGLDEATPVPPTERQVLANAWTHSWDRSGKAVRYLGHAATEALVDTLRRRHADDPPTSAEVPRLSFNGAVGGRRALSSASIPLDRVKRVGKALDVTINDVVLEIVGSTLRRYLEDRGELPDRPLVACVPVSLRKAGDKHLDNQITNMAVSLATDLHSPVERLIRIHRGARRAREKLSEGQVDAFTAIGESLAPFAAHALMQIASSATALENLPLLGNLVISNVRGSPVPLYTAGAKVESMIPMSIVEAGQGLNVTVLSYRDRLDFGFTVDPDLVPDPWSLAERIPAALEELEEDLALVVGGVAGRSGPNAG